LIHQQTDSGVGQFENSGKAPSPRGMLFGNIPNRVHVGVDFVGEFRTHF